MQFLAHISVTEVGVLLAVFVLGLLIGSLVMARARRRV
jgi:hypothetical protein